MIETYLWKSWFWDFEVYASEYANYGQWWAGLFLTKLSLFFLFHKKNALRILLVYRKLFLYIPMSSLALFSLLTKTIARCKSPYFTKAGEFFKFLKVNFIKIIEIYIFFPQTLLVMLYNRFIISVLTHEFTQRHAISCYLWMSYAKCIM